jgi:hypothetical protein
VLRLDAAVVVFARVLTTWLEEPHADTPAAVINVAMAAAVRAARRLNDAESP